MVHKIYQPKTRGVRAGIEEAVALMAEAKRPILYCGGGVINCGPRTAELLTQLVDLTGYPVTLTLMGLGAVPPRIRNSSACSACTAPTRPT